MKAVLSLCLLLAACGRDEDSPDAAASLPFGTYDVSQPVCASTQDRPRYPSPSYKLALFDLDDLAAHTITIAPGVAVETFTSTTCILAVTRSVYRNYGGEFTLRGDRKHQFTPSDCSLTMTLDEHAYSVGRSFTTALDDTTIPDPETPFVVARPTPPSFELASVDRADYNNAWNAYGCQMPDRIVYRYNLK